MSAADRNLWHPPPLPKLKQHGGLKPSSQQHPLSVLSRPKKKAVKLANTWLRPSRMTKGDAV